VGSGGVTAGGGRVGSGGTGGVTEWQSEDGLAGGFLKGVKKRGWEVEKVLELKAFRVCHAYVVEEDFLDLLVEDEDGYQGEMFRLRGESRLLADQYLKGGMPFGILLDRLQECPEEVEGASSEVVSQAVEWMRGH
jgi:hypothetical protein